MDSDMSLPNWPTTMKAAILVEQTQPLVIDEVRLPETLFCGQVLVRLAYSGICGSQLGEIEGAKGPDRFLPHMLGHEGSGTVVEVGPGVTRINAGDHVVLHWMKAPGIEATPPVYSWRGKPLNSGWVTTFNQYAIVSENRLTPIPTSVDGRIAALFGCAVTTGLGVVINNARLIPGESIAVFGAGGVGLNVIQGAAITSAWPIIGVDIHDNRLPLAREMGATHFLNSRNCDLRAEVREIVGPGGVDVIVDNTGIPEMIELAYELTAPKGRVVLVGVPRKGQNISIYSLSLHFGKVLTGSHGGESNPAADIPRYLKLLHTGKLNLGSLITHEFSLENVNDAIAMMRAGEVAGRCCIRMEHP
jgi:S-(hydroxymethyl)glutathione dehydrogenase/alcohol dehydrogenase